MERRSPESPPVTRMMQVHFNGKGLSFFSRSNAVTATRLRASAECVAQPSILLQRALRRIN